MFLHEAVRGPADDRVFKVPHVGSLIVREDPQDEHPGRVYVSDVQGLKNEEAQVESRPQREEVPECVACGHRCVVHAPTTVFIGPCGSLAPHVSLTIYAVAITSIAVNDTRRLP